MRDRSSTRNDRTAVSPPARTILRRRSLSESSLAKPMRVHPLAIAASVPRRTFPMAMRSASCARAGVASPMAATAIMPMPRSRAVMASERNREQGVDPAAVTDDHALAEAEGARLLDEDVHVAAGGEEAHGAVAHDAYDDKGRLRPCGAVPLAEYRGARDHVSVRRGLVC